MCTFYNLEEEEEAFNFFYSIPFLMYLFYYILTRTFGKEGSSIHLFTLRKRKTTEFQAEISNNTTTPPTNEKESLTS